MTNVKTISGTFADSALYANAMQSILDSTWRPEYYNDQGLICNRDGSLRTNAFLSREEWERLDAAIAKRIAQRINIVGDLQAAGLSDTLPIGVYLSKWRVASERIAAQVTMEFETRVDSDRSDFKHYAVPVPIYQTDYDFGRRYLESVRLAGRNVETTEAELAAEAVVETVESVIVNGSTDISVEGYTIPGLRTLASRTTGTAAAFGGGDFGTISNILPTFLGVYSTLSGNRYYGPFNIYIANTQYVEMLNRYTDGSSKTALQVIEELPFVNFVKANDLMTAGEMVWYQPSSDVIDLRVALDMENVRWEAPDQSRAYYKVMWAGVCRMKTDYAGNAGIAQVTSC